MTINKRRQNSRDSEIQGQIAAGFSTANPEDVLSFKEEYPVFAAIEPKLGEITAEQFIRLVSDDDNWRRIKQKVIIDREIKKQVRAKARALRKAVNKQTPVQTSPFLRLPDTALPEPQVSPLCIPSRRSPHLFCFLPNGFKIIHLAKPNRDRQFDLCGRRRL